MAPRTIRKRQRHPVVNMLYLLVSAVLAGGVVAAIAFPAVAGTGLAAKQSADSFEDLPADLKIPPSHEDSYLYAADGKTLITAFYAENRREVALPEIPAVMRQAIVAAEDNRFYQHRGVDMKGVLRSLVANDSAGTVQQGASTLTMQYVRNVLVDSADTPEQVEDATAQTPARKVREMRYAVALEQHLSKQEILRRYLNIALFGHQAYGVYAASETYFSVPPEQLTLDQAALLAGLVQSPNAYDPTLPDQRPAMKRRDYVLDQMARLHDITAKQAEAAKKKPIALNPSRVPNGCTDVPANHLDWGFYCDWFVQWWQSQPAFGSTTQARTDALKQGGYRIVSTLDPKVQGAAESRVLQQVSVTNPNAINMAVVQPGTGNVLAMATNRRYSLDTSHNLPSTRGAGVGNYPNTTNPLVAGGGDIVGYQAGSTFKLFTMLAALSTGHKLSTSFNAPARLQTKYPTGDGPATCNHHWCPVNANPSWMDGTRTMWNGFGRSVNTYFAWLEENVGADRAVAMARNLGVRFLADSDEQLATHGAAGWGAFTLGVAAVTPLDLANAYATVAAGGKYCVPRAVNALSDRDGRPVAVGAPACRQAVTPDVAAAAADAARCPVQQQSYYGKCDGGTAPPGFGSLVGRPMGGKTGTTDGEATATFVGFTRQLAAAAIAADPDNPQHYVGEAYADKVDFAVGYTLRDASAGLPALTFPKPSAAIAGVGTAKPKHR